MGARRPWGVILATPASTRHGGVDFAQTEFAVRTYATEAAAEEAAVRLTTDIGDGHFVAARISAPVDADWPVGVVVEYRDGLSRRFNVLDGTRWETAS